MADWKNVAIADLERQLAEARAKIDVQRESKEYAQRCCEAAEAERDRLAADNARLTQERDEKIAQALAKADYEAERAGNIENDNDRLTDELRAVRAQLDIQLAGHRLTAKDATKQLLRATRLEEAITRVVDPAPGCNCPPWILGILKAALAGKE